MASATRAWDAAASASQRKEQRSQSCRAIWCAATLAEGENVVLAAMAAASARDVWRTRERMNTEEDAVRRGWICW